MATDCGYVDVQHYAWRFDVGVLGLAAAEVDGFVVVCVAVPSHCALVVSVAVGAAPVGEPFWVLTVFVWLGRGRA